MSWLINIFVLYQIWALYLQQVLNNTPVNKDQQPNFKLCPATLGCRNTITVHFWTYISKNKNFKMCFRWRGIWCGWCFGVQSYLKGLWHASAHVRHLDLWSGEPFFQNSLLVKKFLFHRLWDAIISVFEDILYILEVLNAIFCHEEKCTKAYYLLSVFLQTDQMWGLMWSSGFYFCLLSSPVNDLPFPVRI